jgi:hypothetical protein
MGRDERRGLEGTEFGSKTQPDSLETMVSGIPFIHRRVGKR